MNCKICKKEIDPYKEARYDISYIEKIPPRPKSCPTCGQSPFIVHYSDHSLFPFKPSNIQLCEKCYGEIIENKNRV